MWVLWVLRRRRYRREISYSSSLESDRACPRPVRSHREQGFVTSNVVEAFLLVYADSMIFIGVTSLKKDMVSYLLSKHIRSGGDDTRCSCPVCCVDLTLREESFAEWMQCPSCNTVGHSACIRRCVLAPSSGTFLYTGVPIVLRHRIFHDGDPAQAQPGACQGRPCLGLCHSCVLSQFRV